MPPRRATVRALLAGAVTGFAAVLAGALVWLSLSHDVSQAHGDSTGRYVTGRVVLSIPGGGRVLVSLPDGWSAARVTPGTIALRSRRTCHTATLTAFVDRTRERPAQRAVRLLGYVSGREFDSGRLWRGTTSGGRGYAVYDPRGLVGTEVVRAGGTTIAIVLHGMPVHGQRCSRHEAAAPRWELSRLLQDLRLPGSGRLTLKAMPHA